MIIRVIGILFVLSMVVTPVNALALDVLDIHVLESGDAVVEVWYTPSLLERITVFLGVTNLEEEIQRAIADGLGKEVIVFNGTQVVKSQGGPYTHSYSNLEDNIVYIPLPAENITGNGMVLRLGIKNFATKSFVEKVKTNVKSMATGDPVPGAEIYIEQAGDEPVVGGEQSGEDGGFGIYTTPELSFADAEKTFNQLWFAPLINMDFSPDVTRITFPGKDSIKFSNQISVPPFNYTVKSSHSSSKGGFAVGGFSLA